MDQIAYFGNVNLMIGNVDGTARELRFYQPNLSFNYTGPTYYTSFKATGQSANIDYILPASQGATNTALVNNGTGILHWGTASDIGAWQLIGNATTGAGEFLGTTTTQSLELKVNSSRVMLYQYTGSQVNVIGGDPSNTANSAVGATISGGGATSNGNSVTDDFGTIGGGKKNRAGDNAGTPNDRLAATVGGGYNNIAGGSYSTVAGGNTNTASGEYAAILSGLTNQAPSAYSTVVGGSGNIAGDATTPANSQYSAVVGGLQNNAIASYSFAGGGQANIVEPPNSVIVGGNTNHIYQTGSLTADYKADYDFIGGGDFNQMYVSPTGKAPTGSVIVGGNNNRLEQDYNFIGGGQHNLDSGSYGVIVGGAENFIGERDHNYHSVYDFIGGGYDNQILGQIVHGPDAVPRGTVIVGGMDNQAQELASFIGGGSANRVLEDYDVIVGGESNYISSGDGAIVGGRLNAIRFDLFGWNFIGGGRSNVIDGNAVLKPYCANIPGGDHLVANSYSQTVIGYYNDSLGSSTGAAENSLAMTHNVPDDPILIVGNGNGIASNAAERHNAFEVTNDGHSIVFDTLGANNSGTMPMSAEVPTLGGTYVDNVVYAWGIVTAAGPLLQSFGTRPVSHAAGTNKYVVELDLQDQHSNPIVLTSGSVTATVLAPDVNDLSNTDPGCATISVSKLYTSSNGYTAFTVWTHTVGPTTDCVPTGLAFQFKVCGRP
jgi:hypothetical protein